MESVNQLGEYLRVRRARVAPEDVNLPTLGTRRVPGLRREEVASLAGLSVDYYTRLEQGRERNPSPNVLRALAGAFRLNPDAERYLYAIAGTGSTDMRSRRNERVTDNLLALVEEWDSHPAVLLDGCHNLVAGNRLGRALYGGHRHSDNLARLLFLDPDGPVFFRQWDQVAGRYVASMRVLASRDPGDRNLADLVRELSLHSDIFTSLWSRADVWEETSDRLRLRHQVVGDLDLYFERLQPNGAPDLVLKIYRAVPGTGTEDRLAQLAA